MTQGKRPDAADIGRSHGPEGLRAAFDNAKRGAESADAPLIESKNFVEAQAINEFIARHGADFRYVAAWGMWLRWDGSRWLREQTRLATNLIAEICARLAKTGVRISGARVATVENLAQTRRVVARTADIWDANPLMLNTTGGTYNLVNDVLSAWRREDNLTKLARAVPRGDCPKWRNFLHVVTAGNVELQAYLQRVAGYCLTGATGEHAMFFLHGDGANGKSTLVSVLCEILGDYARNVPAETFMESRHDRHPTELAAMMGYRLVTANEIRRGARWNEARLKELTGGEKISARFMRQDFFDYLPQFKLVISGNHKPSLRSTGEAMRRRLHLVPFTASIPKADRIKDFWRVLIDEERDGILNWAVEGCRDWQREALNPPASVLAATERYFADQDVVGRWIAECCIERKAARVRSKDLFSSWKAWCEANGENAGTNRLFSQSLEERGIDGPHHDRNGKYFNGIELATAARTNSASGDV